MLVNGPLRGDITSRDCRMDRDSSNAAFIHSFIHAPTLSRAGNPTKNKPHLRHKDKIHYWRRYYQEVKVNKEAGLKQRLSSVGDSGILDIAAAQGTLHRRTAGI